MFIKAVLFCKSHINQNQKRKKHSTQSIRMFEEFQSMFKKIPGKVGDLAKQLRDKANVSINQKSQYEDTSKIPQTYTIQNRTIREKNLLSEGAFGFIWKAEDILTKQQFALKRVICMNKERLNSALIQKNILSKLPNTNQNIVKFYGSQIIKSSDKTTIVTVIQLCSGGSLFDLLQKRQSIGFKQHQILSIAMSAIKGLHGIHTIGYYHRDVKIENILIGKDGKYKLCDFGSCTNQQIDFKVIPKSDYNDYLQQIESFTTPMYRPPQMVDPYLKYKVSFKADIWMLGCTLYTLCYFVHPFLDSNAVGIANAVFRFPVYPSETKYKVSEKIQDLIRLMLTPDPQHRPTLKQLATIISQWQNIKEIPLNPVARRLKEQHTQKQQQLQSLNKKTVDIDGDIPIEKLMALQNKIRNKECNKQTSSFITDNQTKKIRQNQQSHSQKNNFQQVSDSFGVSINQNNKKNNVFNNKDIWGSSPQQSHQNNGSFTKAQSKPSFDAFSDFGNFGSTHSKPTQKKQQMIKTNNDFMEFFQQTPVQQNTISQGKKQKQKFDLLDI